MSSWLPIVGYTLAFTVVIGTLMLIVNTTIIRFWNWIIKQIDGDKEDE